MGIYLGLGSNSGDRQGSLQAAIRALNALEGVSVIACSPTYETAPVGVLDQPPFLNLAAEIETVITPLELLNAAKIIEGQLGRKAGPRWGPREIDIDLILWGDTVVDTSTLTIPHAEFRKRAFVLQPLSDIAPDARDPLTGMTVAELAAQPGVEGTAIRLVQSTP